MNEIWKDVIGYEGKYQVSNLGNVKSLNYNRTGIEKLLKKVTHPKGYDLVCLHLSKTSKTRKVHQLVVESFLNHKRCGMKLVVDHINDVRNDNRLENLQIITNRNNACRTQGRYTSKYKGVCWYKKYNKWKSQIHINGKTYHLGYFEKEYDAYVEYQNKLLTLNN